MALPSDLLVEKLLEAIQKESLQFFIDWATRYTKTNPTHDRGVLNMQDETGRTFWHYLAEMPQTDTMYEQIISLIEDRSNEGTRPDLSITDNKGNTPLHILAGRAGRERPALVMRLINLAAGQGFDFTQRNDAGYSVLHLAAIHQPRTTFDSGRTRVYPELASTRQEPVATILDATKARAIKLDLNQVSKSGTSALCYCIAHYRFAEAQALLAAGAEVEPAGQSEDRHPLDEIKDKIKELYTIKFKADFEYDKRELTKQANTLRKDMEAQLAQKADSGSDGAASYRVATPSANTLAERRLLDPTLAGGCGAATV